MRKVFLTGVAACIVSAAVGFYYYNSRGSEVEATNQATQAATVVQLTNVKELQKELQKYKDKEAAEQLLGQYAINMMYRTAGGKKLSDAKKQILARAIVRVTNDIFETEDNRRAFIAVLAIESQFDRLAQSPTGPKGFAQLAKATFHEAMADCGVTGLKDDDVWETDLNLYAGACYFKKLLMQNNNDPYIAIVAYNQGPNSDSAKTYAKSGYMTELEPLKYVARFTFLKRNVTDQQTPDVPNINDLPKPVAPASPAKKK